MVAGITPIKPASMYVRGLSNKQKAIISNISVKMLPNDDKEQERLDILHHVFRLTLGGALCRTAPDLHNPGLILDIGTGTGIWAIDSMIRLKSVVVADILPQWVMNTLQQRS